MNHMRCNHDKINKKFNATIGAAAKGRLDRVLRRLGEAGVVEAQLSSGVCVTVGVRLYRTAYRQRISRCQHPGTTGHGASGRVEGV
jgi:hypothetical protein